MKNINIFNQKSFKIVFSTIIISIILFYTNVLVVKLIYYINPGNLSSIFNSIYFFYLGLNISDLFLISIISFKLIKNRKRNKDVHIGLLISFFYVLILTILLICITIPIYYT